MSNKRHLVIEWAPNHFITEDLKAWPLRDHKRTFELYVQNELYVVPVSKKETRHETY